MSEINITESDVKWIVNDCGELGVKIAGRCFFLYKGYSLEYKDGKHDDGSPMLYRRVGKREFGETCCPEKYLLSNTPVSYPYTQECICVGEDDDDHEYKWQPLPTNLP